MKWNWTPKGWLLAIVAVGLLAGAAFLNQDGNSEQLVKGILTLSLVILGMGWLVIKYREKKEKG